MALATSDIVAVIKKRPVAIGCGILSIVFLVVCYVRSSKVSEQVTLLKQREEEGQKILNDIRSGSNLAEQHESLLAAAKEFESRLVRGTERARNQQYFYRIESETGVKEVSLQPNSANPIQLKGPKKLYAGVGYTVSVQGDYRQVLDFIGRIESGTHFYRLITGSVSRQGQRGAPDSTNTLALTLNLELLGMP
jgi:hypothetical protein